MKQKLKFNKVVVFENMYEDICCLGKNELEYLLTGVLMMMMAFKIKMKFCNCRTINPEYQLENTGVLTAGKLNEINFKKQKKKAQKDSCQPHTQTHTHIRAHTCTHVSRSFTSVCLHSAINMKPSWKKIKI